MIQVIHTYIAACCCEWVVPYGNKGGRCGLGGERPTYLRDDPESPMVVR